MWQKSDAKSSSASGVKTKVRAVGGNRQGWIAFDASHIFIRFVNAAISGVAFAKSTGLCLLLKTKPSSHRHPICSRYIDKLS